MIAIAVFLLLVVIGAVTNATKSATRHQVSGPVTTTAPASTDTPIAAASPIPSDATVESTISPTETGAAPATAIAPAGSPPAPTAFPSTPAPTAPAPTAPAITAPAAPPSGLLTVSGDEKTVLNTDLLVGPCTVHQAANGQALPDPACTPGVVAARVTQANIATTICARGYTTTVRPPTSITNPMKKRTAELYRVAYTPTVEEYDHLIPLELGGANDVRNLWVEPPTSATQTTTTNAKDGVETKLKNAVCGGRISLVDAQRRIATDWTTALAGV